MEASLMEFALALLPIAWLAVALTMFRMPSHLACLSSLGIAVMLAAGVWHLGVACVATAVLEGVLNALWPICLVVIAALFTYNLIVRTGAMDLIKRMLAGVSKDTRVLALLIGWGFGNFMEGMAGFGTAVAIPASMLVGVGLNPLAAVVGCLVVNSTPTAFGSVGVPTVTLASVTGLETLPLSADIALIQCALTFISPFFLVCICGGGVKALRGMTLTTLAASLSFVVPWFAVANVLGPELPDIVGAVCSMVCIVALARLSRGGVPAAYSIDSVEKDEAEGGAPTRDDRPVPRDSFVSHGDLRAADAVKAWSPFILILVLLMGTSSLFPLVHQLLAGFKTVVVVYAGDGGNVLSFSWLNTPGVMIFLAALIGGWIQGASPKVMCEVFGDTLRRYWKTVLTICCVMAMAKVMGYAGMIADIAAVLVVVAGPAYPFIAPVVGALGAFVTGSGTSTNVLFGSLQAQTAAALGLSPSWMAAANVMGAGIGKMVCPQSIAIGAGATGLMGEERAIMGSVFRYFALYVLIAGAICVIGAC